MSKGPKDITPSTATSQFKGDNTYNVGLGGFGNTQASNNGGQISSQTTLDPSLQGIQQSASQGLNQNSQYLAQSPDQQYSSLQAGNNPYYNALKSQNDLNYQTQYSQLQNALSNNGMQNSSTLGAFAGQQARDSNLVNSQNIATGLQTGNTIANQNAGTQGNILNSIYGYEAPQSQQAQQGLLSSLTAQDANAQFNATQTQSADQYNSQAGAARGALANSGIGSLIGAGLSIAASPFTGGASLLALPGMGASAFGGQSPSVAYPQTPQYQSSGAQQGLGVGGYQTPQYQPSFLAQGQLPLYNSNYLQSSYNPNQFNSQFIGSGS